MIGKLMLHFVSMLIFEKENLIFIFCSCSSSVSSDGDVGDNAKKNYRLASSFELGDEQPTGDASQWRKKEDDSFHKLFGPPSLIKTEKPVEVSDQVQMIKKTVTKKPLPGDTLSITALMDVTQVETTSLFFSKTIFQ